MVYYAEISDKIHTLPASISYYGPYGTRREARAVGRREMMAAHKQFGLRAVGAIYFRVVAKRG